MSALFRTVSLTALAALIGIASAGEVKGPVHISSDGVTDFGGDTARFKAAMDADARGEIKLFVNTRIVVRHVAAISRDEAREAATEARNAAREAAREASREAQDYAREARGEARVQVEQAMAIADEAMRGARQRIAEARRDIAERKRELHDQAEALNRDHHGRWDNAIEIRDGKVVRCSNPAKYPGTNCTPFSPEEKARMEAEAHAAAEQARAAMAQAEADLRDAERALKDETNP